MPTARETLTRFRRTLSGIWADRESRGLRTALGILACALAALVYENSLDNPFVFDDRDTVLLNPALVHAWDLWAALAHTTRPVVTVSYAVDRALWGFSSFGFHCTNVVLHVVVVGLVYGWCTRALTDGVRPGSDRGQTRVRPGSDRGQTRVKRRSDPGLTPDWAAFFAAAVFAVHPLMTAAVGYTTARSELLCAAGVLVSLTYARRAILRSSTRAGIMAGLFGILAIGSSSSAAALPLIALAYDAWVLRDAEWRRRAWRVYFPVMAAIALAAAWDLRAAGAVVPPRAMLNNLLTEVLVVWRYVGLLLTLHPQALVHHVHTVATPLAPAGLVGLTILAACVAGAIRGRRAMPLVAFGTICFLAVLAPTSSVIPVRDPMAEERVYLASAGLLLALASVLAAPLAARRGARLVATAVLVVLAVQTVQRNRLWSDPLKLWEEAVQRSPGAWEAHLGYADILREIGACERAVPEYEEAIRLNPADAAAAARLASCR